MHFLLSYCFIFNSNIKKCIFRHVFIYQLLNIGFIAHILSLNTKKKMLLFFYSVLHDMTAEKGVCKLSCKLEAFRDRPLLLCRAVRSAVTALRCSSTKSI